ncbi:MAG: hypothetical protein MUO88_08620 [Desulfobacterales bacterium]|nr:hypothetical protein [Desulfobacterales bacterium]
MSEVQCKNGQGRFLSSSADERKRKFYLITKLIYIAILTLSKYLEYMKYDYNHNIKDVVLVTDDKERTKSRKTSFIFKLLRNNGLNPITTKRFDGEQLRENNEFYLNRDKKVFKKSFDYLTCSDDGKVI